MIRIIRTTALQQLRTNAAELLEARKQLAAARVALDGRDRTDAETLAQIRADLDQLRTDAADPERGKAVSAALAHGVLRRLYAHARAQDLHTRRPWDLLSVVLDLEAEADGQAGYPAPAIGAVGEKAGG